MSARPTPRRAMRHMRAPLSHAEDAPKHCADLVRSAPDRTVWPFGRAWAGRSLIARDPPAPGRTAGRRHTSPQHSRSAGNTCAVGRRRGRAGVDAFALSTAAVFKEELVLSLCRHAYKSYMASRPYSSWSFLISECTSFTDASRPPHACVFFIILMLIPGGPAVNERGPGGRTQSLQLHLALWLRL